jgi:pyruvate dehydrogenase E2 component (dihydrolipoamide acetyltransferase)
MAVEISMPQLSDTMSEGRILVWKKKEGDAVKRGEALAEVATDKADLEIESFHQGTLLKIFSPAGETVKVGSVIAVIGEAGESVGAGGSPAAKASIPVASVAPQSAAQAAPVASNPVASNQPAPVDPLTVTERVKISPLAKNVALNQGVDFTQITGSGEGGRIVKKDVDAYLSGPSANEPAPQAKPAVPQQQPAPQQQPVQAKPVAPVSAPPGSQELSRMRQTISSRMVESKTTIPHFYMTSKIEVSMLAKLRETLKPLPQYEGVTYNHLIIKAVGLALKAQPRINASYQGGNMVQPADINVGIVTALPDGLLIPVVKRADQLSVADIIQESKGLVQRARAGKPKADDLVGGTFSISNVGPFPVESFSAIISPGQGGILAVSAITDEPVLRDGAVVPGKVMRVTLSVDHRIIDGVVSGEFLKELKKVLEEPVLLLA